MQGDGQLSQRHLSTLIGRFAGHVFLGVAGFLVLAIPAVILSLAAYYLDQTGVSRFIIVGLLIVHYFIFVVDAIMFVAYIAVSMYAAAVELVDYVKGLR